MQAMTNCCCVLILLMTVVSGCGLSQTNDEIIPKAWQPSLASVQAFMASSQVDPVPINQRALNDQSQHLADILDAQLLIVYVQLLQTLDSKARYQLFKEQTRWLHEREVMSKKSILSEGGSLAMLEYNGAFIKITRDRLAALKDRLGQD